MKILPVFMAIVVWLTGCTSDAPQQVLRQAGWLEQVQIYPSEMILHSKLDTGADNCSVHALDIKYFNKNGKEHVSYFIENRYGEQEKIESEIIKIAKIKTKTGGFQLRPVVKIEMCLGDVYESVECNLVDRSHFKYPVLIGRNFLSGSFLVNSSKSFITTPNCAKNE